MITPIEFVKNSCFLNEENIKNFRQKYRQLNKINNLNNQIDEEKLYEVAKQFGIKTEPNIYVDILRMCIRYEDEEQTFEYVQLMLNNFQMISTSLDNTDSHPTSKSDSAQNISKDEKVPTILSEIDCLLFITRRENEVDNFLKTFLLQDPNRAINLEFDISYKKQFHLHPQSLLAMFIHSEVRSLGTVQKHQLDKLTLAEQLETSDEFGPFQFDYLRGLFSIELRPHIEKSFPVCWVLKDDALINCQLEDRHANQACGDAKHTPERPNTNSLKQFVNDVCAKEGNKKADEWLSGLYAEDIYSFVHLSILKQSEWDNIKKLPMMAKRTLKAAVDLVLQTADDGHGGFKKGSTDMSDNLEADSNSELLANLHLIKLYFHHKLQSEPALEQCTPLPKLEATCIAKSFAELHQEGYEDDGIFSEMVQFFLPMTISENELKMERLTNHQDRQQQKNKDEKAVESLQKHLEATTISRWDIDGYRTILTQKIDAAFSKHIIDCSNVDKTMTQENQERQLQQLNRKLQKELNELESEKHECEKSVEQLDNTIKDYEKQMDVLNCRIKSIEIEMKQPQCPVKKDLVKPARGFIMHGPPGTGKSEIMSKLSKKLGIAMVATPLAAGELNRSLVGESERVIIALASRCHRVPYAICCLLIDEIDSLAPKRDEDSSEGKVDKISVLLSLIDGIKDVPNLMIFCATNRMHMMDEAFLRRMSGKYFVGRPSSQARKNILSKIPGWALETNTIDQLVSALTNFSGAACKAFTRDITIRCICEQRKNPDYTIKYSEALKIAHRTAKQYQIFLGSETIPRLLLRNSEPNSLINHLRRSDYTGRIIIDLHGGSARIEITDSETVLEYELGPKENKMQNLVERLASYGKDRNVQIIQLIDINLLASQGAFDDKKIFETLKDRYGECIEYNRSMIIFDLDALVGVNKSESDSAMGQSTNASVVNQSVYTYVRARFRETDVEKQQENNKEKQTEEKWAIAVIREPYLLKQFSNDVEFAPTREEVRVREIEQRKANVPLKCVKCKDFYLEAENKMGNCVHHDGFIYNNSLVSLDKCTYSHVVYKLNELEFDVVRNPEKREKLEQEKSKFKWICCDTTVTTGTSAGGCKKGKHGFDVKDDDSHNPRRNEPHLVQEMIDLWEADCDNNSEYREKWLLLVDKRLDSRSRMN